MGHTGRLPHVYADAHRRGVREDVLGRPDAISTPGLGTVRVALAVAVAAGALALLAYLATVLVGGPIGFRYDKAPGFASARMVAHVGAVLASAGLFLAGTIVVLPVALRPAPWPRKLVCAVPLYLLAFTVSAAASGFIGIGTVGNLAGGAGVGNVTFARAWLALGAVLSTIAVWVVITRANLSATSLKATLRVLTATVAIGLVVAVAMIASAVIVMTAEPSGDPPAIGSPRQIPISQFAGGAIFMALFTTAALIGIRRASHVTQASGGRRLSEDCHART